MDDGGDALSARRGSSLRAGVALVLLVGGAALLLAGPWSRTTERAERHGQKEAATVVPPEEVSHAPDTVQTGDRATGIEPASSKPGEGALSTPKGREPKRRVLRVVDADTREPIPLARVYLRKERFANLVEHAEGVLPAESTVASAPIIANEQGLIELGPGGQCWWVIAEGYAWHPVLCGEEAVEAPILVALRHHGGRLALRIRGWRAQEGLHVFAVAGGSAISLPTLLHDGLLLVEGVREGEFRIVVKEGRSFWIDGGRTYAQADVRVARGTTTHAVLDLSPPDNREVVRTRVLLATDSDWDWAQATAAWVGVDARTQQLRRELRLLPTQSGPALASEIQELPEGQYDLQVDMPDLIWTQRMELAGRFVEPLIQIPGSAEVNVQVTTASSGPLSDYVELHWTVLDDATGVARGFTSVPPKTGSVVVRVPAGKLTMSVLSGAYLEARLDLGIVRTGTSTQAHFEVTPSCTIDLLIYNGSELLDRAVVLVELEPLDGQSDAGTGRCRFVATGRPISLTGLAPGRCVVRFSVEGYKPQVVDGVIVEAGQASQIERRLEK